MKNCSGNWQCCEYAIQYGCYVKCRYYGYCDYQLPKDKSPYYEFPTNPKE